MSIFKIALLQISPTGTVKGNLEKGLSFCKKAKHQGADLVLFPEAWQVGYETDLMNLENAISASKLLWQMIQNKY